MEKHKNRMKCLRNASLQFKQTAIIMATTTMALLLAGAALVIFEVVSFRANMARDLTVMADVMGDNCTASLAFNDTKSAEETLAALKDQPHIIAAFIFSKDGKVFARYGRANDGRSLSSPKLQKSGHYFKGNDLMLF